MLTDRLSAVSTASIESRAVLFAALADPSRLAIADELATSDRTPGELLARTGLPSNLLAHHLDVLQRAGVITRHRSSGDGRRRYVRLNHCALRELQIGRRVAPGRALFICSHNSARSQLAAALWRRATGRQATSAGTDPVDRVHPGAVASARRIGLDLSGAVPRRLDRLASWPPLVITVCDQAHESLGPAAPTLHWSVPDPVPLGTARAFDRARDELDARIARFVELAEHA